MASHRLIGIALGALLASAGAFAQAEAPQGSGMLRHWQNAGAEQVAAWHRKTCTDHHARTAGRLAYLETKIGITGEQTSAYDRWRDVVLSDARGRQQACLSHSPQEHVATTALDREAVTETMLTARLHELQTQRPALEALYQSLNAEQKIAFDGTARRRGHHGTDHTRGRRMDGHGDGERKG